jgi:hypothetical protein
MGLCKLPIFLLSAVLSDRDHTRWLYCTTETFLKVFAFVSQNDDTVPFPSMFIHLYNLSGQSVPQQGKLQGHGQKGRERSVA